ncbi:hypothetical protein BH10ACT10_BH10ACT10_05540 [soil metagenome]
MTSLVHLNGPPGVGKSTLAALYADRHPGTLDLDIDRLHHLVGGWQDADNRTHDVLRPVALAMAATHLGGGRDVVLPQYLVRADEIDAFERVSREQGAEFREVVLLPADRADAVARFDHRPDDGPWDDHNRRLVAGHGGPDLLGSLYDELVDLVRRRPSVLVVASEPDAVEATYAAVLRALLD